MKYSLSVDKQYLDEVLKIKTKNLKIDNEIEFETDNKGYEFLKNRIPLLSSVNHYQILRKSILKKYIILILGLLLLIFSLNVLSKSITKIKFIDENDYNQEVYNYVSDKLRNVGPFKFLKSSLNDINRNLRSEFYNYEWVGITKKGTTLYIDIENNSLNYENHIEDEVGNMYASKDAIVKFYHLEKGVVFVQEDQSVQKGELLISGTIPHYNQEDEYVHPKGYVIGETIEIKEIMVLKQKEDIKRSGKVQIVNVWFKGDKQLSDIEYNFINYEINFQKIFSFLNFTLYQVEIFELIENIVKYNEEEAIEYAQTICKREFYEIERIKDEKIISIKYISTLEDEDAYYIKFIIKAYENIAVFKKTQ